MRKLSISFLLIAWLVTPMAHAASATIDFTIEADWGDALGESSFASLTHYLGATVTAMASHGELDWTDDDGLGIDSGAPLAYENDEIEGSEILTIKFSKFVILEAIGLADLFKETGIEGYPGTFIEMGTYWVNNDVTTETDFFADPLQITGTNGELLFLTGLNMPIDRISFKSPGKIENIEKDGREDHEYALQSLQISEVPVPAAIWLFGTALIGFIGFSRRTTV